MSAPSLKSQASLRAFAFGDQEQTHVAPSLPAIDRSRLAKLADLEQRATVMYANGYRASGDALMARLARMEHGA